MARGDTFHFTDGRTVTGDIVGMNDDGVVLKQADGSYGDRIPWTKFSQADLKNLEQDPKAAQFVEPYIEQSKEDVMKRTEVEVKEFPKLPRPAKHSLIAALLTSGMGLFIFVMVYGGNLYAAWEIAVFRAQSPPLVCGISAVAPFIGPIVFLAMPTRLKPKEAEWKAPAEERLDSGVAAAIAAEEAVPVEEHPVAEIAPAGAAPAAHAAPAAANVPAAKVFARGQFTFNRRFFETQMPGFFAIARPEADKDKVLTVKSARGIHIAQRICRISANDLTLQVQKGVASEEVTVPFVEIQEVQLKHKDG